MAAALIIDPLLMCSVRWKEKQLLPAGIKLQQRSVGVNAAPASGGEEEVQ